MRDTSISKEELARILKEIAFFLRLHGATHHKVKRFQGAADAVLQWPHEMPAAIHRRGVMELPHIDKIVDAVIVEILTTGRCTLHQEVCGAYPRSLAELQDVPCLNTKQIVLLYRQAGVRSLADLRRAVSHPEHLLGIPGFGPRNVARLAQAVH